MIIGTGINIEKFDEEFQRAEELGFRSCQLGGGDGSNLTRERATGIARKLAEAGMSASSFWPGYPIPNGMQWEYRREGRPDIGLVPPETRAERIACFKKASDFAAWVGVPAIAQHVGYVPEDPSDPGYESFLNDMGDLLDYCYRHDGQYLLFETGQETPAALLRLFEDLDRPNVGVNYDTANLILYGKANPLDGLDVIGSFVRDVHAKDGLYPTSGYHLGKMVPLGEGKVDFPGVVAKLKTLGYDGAITIEIELHGVDPKEALCHAKTFLESLLNA